jgi:UDP-glucose 4-epimerase
VRIFMTGATGFIGSHVAYRLIEAGHELTIIARNPQKLTALSSHPQVKRISATLYDFEVIRTALIGCQACIHVALGWGDTPIDMLKTDTTATVSLLTSCLDLGIEHFIYTSSTAALGEFFASMNECDRLAPIDYYGATKAASEAFVLAAASNSKMRCNVIRPGYTFGNPVVPGATTQSDPRFRKIVQCALSNDDIVLQAGDGTQFIWAGDLARLYEAVLNSARNREVYYGLGVPFVSWQSIAEKAIELIGSKTKILLQGKPEAPKLFDLSKIREHFGLAFAAEPHLPAHLRYLIEELRERRAGQPKGNDRTLAQ